jgi:hypothetical protein
LLYHPPALGEKTLTNHLKIDEEQEDKTNLMGSQLSRTNLEANARNEEKIKEIQFTGCGTVLDANAGALPAYSYKTGMTPRFEGNAVSAQPTERRYVDLDVFEFADASKLESIFELTRMSLGLMAAVDQPFKVMDLTLMCEHPEALELSDVLDWVETQTGPGGSAFRVHGDTISGLLTDTGASRLMTEIRNKNAGVVHAVTIPFGGAEALLWPGHEDAKRFAVRVATKDAKPRLRLVAELLVGQRNACVIPVLGMPRHDTLVARQPVAEGQLEIDVTLHRKHGLLRMLTAAVPRILGPVKRIALMLDGRELVGLPGLVAALDVMNIRGEKIPQNNPKTRLLLLPLSALPRRAPDGSLYVSGELHLDAPAVRSGSLALRITLEEPGSPSFVHVQAYLLEPPADGGKK